jgi:SAM-dependent methyltransferase
MRDASYVFAVESDSGSERFAALAEIYDDATTRLIAALGIGCGAACLEVGAGGGSIAQWLAERVAPGRVVATDRDTAFLERVALHGVELRRHDIEVDPLPENTFDLVHARLVVMHLTDAFGAIVRMVRALKPAGWLIVEEFDAGGAVGGPALGAVPKSSLAFRAVLEREGVDLGLGGRLPLLFKDAGLREIGGEMRSVLWRGGSPGARLMRANYAGLRDAMLATALVQPHEFADDIRRLNDPEFLSATPTMWSVWGRRLE